MGKTDVFGKRSLVVATITPGGGTPLAYGFLTNIDSTEQGQLGLVPLAAGNFVTIGVNIPKPTRMIKKQMGYSVSSFVSTASLVGAISSGWKIQKNGTRYYHNSANTFSGITGPSVSVYIPVTVGSFGFKYAWKIPRQQVAKILNSDRTQLGIVVPTTDADARDMLFGANNVKPARATRTIETAGSNRILNITTFYDQTKILTSWRHISSIQIKTAKPEF